MSAPRLERIRLRPYHPGYLLAYLALGETGDPRPAMQYGLRLLRSCRPDTEAELVQEYDDVCLHCERLETDPQGSVWGPGYSCPSSRSTGIVAEVHRENDVILEALNCTYGAVFRAEVLFALFADRLPGLAHLPMQGSAVIQENYRAGLARLHQQWTGREDGSVE